MTEEELAVLEIIQATIDSNKSAGASHQEALDAVLLSSAVTLLVAVEELRRKVRVAEQLLGRRL